MISGRGEGGADNAYQWVADYSEILYHEKL